MSNLAVKFWEGVPHAALDQFFHHFIFERTGEFPALVAASFLAALALAGLGFVGGRFAYYELPGRLKTRLIRRGKPNRLRVLVARIDGPGGRDIRDHIKVQLERVFDDPDIGGWPCDIFEFPLTLRELVVGDLGRNAAKVRKKGRKWLHRAGANLLIWGRAHSNPDHATIYFLLPSSDQGDVYKEDPTVPSSERPYLENSLPGTRIYQFDRKPEEFGADAAKSPDARW